MAQSPVTDTAAPAKVEEVQQDSPESESTKVPPSLNDSTEPDNHVGVRKTPFARPAEAAVIPSPPELSNEQTTKYNSLHNMVSGWSSLPVSSVKDAEHTDITELEQMWLSRECLLRYLRATTWDVNNAIKRLRTTLIWRREYGITSKLTSEYVSAENETGKQWLLGYDIAGRSCHYLNPSRQNTPRSDHQIEHLVFMMERAIDILPPGQESLALLMNFAETKSGQGASIQQGRQTLYILQNHYPERLGKALLTNLPWHISAFMRIIMPFIDPITRGKIVFNESIGNYVPPEQLRKSHGGDLEFEYEHDVYWPALVKLAEDRRKMQYERWVKGGKMIGEFESYLKGGQEEGLRQAMINERGSNELGEKIGEMQLGDKPAKVVAIHEDEKQNGEVKEEATPVAVN